MIDHVPTSGPKPTRLSVPVPTNQPNMPKPKPLPMSKPPKPPVGRKLVSTNDTTATATGGEVSKTNGLYTVSGLLHVLSM